MDKKSLFIATVFLIVLVCWTKSQDFSCKGTLYNIALVYDCCYNLQLQKDFFSQFISNFKPLKSYNNIMLMTYGRSKLLTFEKFTQENFTLDKLNEAELPLNTSSCPQHLPLRTLLDCTREALISDSYYGDHFAIFVMAENLTEYKIDDVILSRELETEKGQTIYIKRLFIFIKPQIDFEVISNTLIYLRTLQNPGVSVDKIKKRLCVSCSDLWNDLILDRSCYYRWPPLDHMTSGQAERLCREVEPNSHLIYFNSKQEYDRVISKMTNILESNAYYCTRVIYKNIPEKFCNTELINGTYVHAFDVFIGLSGERNNDSDNYIWQDGTPLVVDPPWGSRNEGQGCVYMSQKYYDDGGDMTSGQLELNEVDCNTTKTMLFQFCETERMDVEKGSLNWNDFKPKKQESHIYLLYTSYSHLLFNHINNNLENNLTLLMQEKLSHKVIHEACKISFQKYTDISERHLSKYIELISESYLSIPSRCQHFEINQINIPSFQFDDVNLMGQVLRHNETHVQRSNDSSFGIKYLRDPGTAVTKCLYEIDSHRRRVGFQNNSLLQDCEQFVCPSGFVKCHDSYCIPVYLVHDGVKDCPHGEDERSINNETTLCKGQLKFTLTHFCMPQQILSSIGQRINHTYDFVCQIPCDTGYVCVSNVIRNESGNDSTFYIRYVETAVHIYEYSGLFIFTPQIYSLFGLFELVEVDLSNCKIRDLDDAIKSIDISHVIILDVSDNNLSGLNNFSVIQEMKILQMLNMSFNKNLYLDKNFIFPINLQFLDLSHTNCGSGVIKCLANLTSLKILELRSVDPIDLSLTGNVQLDILDVRGTELINIKDGYLSWLSIQTALYTDDFRICCQIIRGPNITEDKCHAPRDAISTCQDLIGDPEKRVILWVVGILSLLGNMAVVIYRIVWDRAVFNKAYGLFVVCLGVSDFIMGVYLIIIAEADLFYRNMYVLEDSNWRHSDICKLAGILSTLSSETSTMFICLITLDRYLVIKYPFGQHRFSKTGKTTSLCLTLIIGFVVSVIPVLFPDWEIYSSNGMCLALPFSSGRHMGWEYSAILFVGLNFFLFMLIAIGQLAIFLAITSYKHDSFCGTRDDLRKAQELSIAKQLFFVAFSDFCCWFPIGIMGIMSLNGFQFNLDVYAWSAVLILPVNSAMNPLLYTLPAILRKIKSGHLVSKQTSLTS